MAGAEKTFQKSTLDKDLAKVAQLERASGVVSRGYAGQGVSLVFLVIVGIVAAVLTEGFSGSVFIVAAAVLGGYMALNIGANDVANNVGPAVGANAMSMPLALIIAAIFESAGALIAGGDVVGTISKGIVDPGAMASAEQFIWAMMAALVSAALWVNLATWIGAPVSTTHSVVGGVVGAGIAAAGFGAVDWSKMYQIAASWLVSPVLGGIIAALFLWFVKHQIIYREDKIAAARKWVPVLIAVMAGSFATYLAIKGLRQVVRIEMSTALLIGLGTAAVFFAISYPLIRRQSERMENRNQSLRRLFTVPLIFSAALLSFAHGANDVANAVGPLAAIVHAVEAGEVAARVHIPFWVMVIGAFGISFGLLLFGPKLIRMVGQQITKLNPMRAYCVALAAAITVILASWLGLPVSSTHIAVGAVFGVGFFREFYTRTSKRRLEMAGPNAGKPIERLPPGEISYRRLVRRAHLLTIAAAWVITVPAAAILSAAVYYALSLVL